MLLGKRDLRQVCACRQQSLLAGGAVSRGSTGAGGRAADRAAADPVSAAACHRTAIAGRSAADRRATDAVAAAAARHAGIAITGGAAAGAETHAIDADIRAGSSTERRAAAAIAAVTRDTSAASA